MLPLLRILTLLAAFLPGGIARTGYGSAVSAKRGGLPLVVFFDLFFPGFLFLLFQLRVGFGGRCWCVGVLAKRILGFPLTVFHDDVDQLIPDVVPRLLRQLVDFFQVGFLGVGVVDVSAVPVPRVLQFHLLPVGLVRLLGLRAGVIVIPALPRILREHPRTARPQQ